MLHARSLKSVLVLLTQILGPFGPPKQRNFRHVKKTSKVRTLHFDPQSLNDNKPLLPFCVLFNKAASISSGIYFVPKLLLLSSFLVLQLFGSRAFWSSQMPLVIQLFGPPKCLWSSRHTACAGRFQGPGGRGGFTDLGNCSKSYQVF